MPVYAGTIRLAVVWLSHTTDRLMLLAYTKCDVQLLKVAPDDGLI